MSVHPGKQSVSEQHSISEAYLYLMKLVLMLVTRASCRLHSRHQVNPVSIAMLFAAVKPGFNCGMCPALQEAFAPDEAALTPTM